MPQVVDMFHATRATTVRADPERTALAPLIRLRSGADRLGRPELTLKIPRVCDDAASLRLHLLDGGPTRYAAVDHRLRWAHFTDGTRPDTDG